MFGMGMPEILVILGLALIIIGPKKLPELAKSLGKALGEFKSAASDIKESLTMESELEEIKESFKNTEEELKKSITSYEQTDNGKSEKSSSQNKTKAPSEDIEIEKEADLNQDNIEEAPASNDRTSLKSDGSVKNKK